MMRSSITLLTAILAVILGPASVAAQIWHPDVELDSYEGTVLVDSSLSHERYYLDTTSDGEPDYLLVFGPWWYEPGSGAVRPAPGDIVTVTASMSMAGPTAALVVYELDGKVWREVSEIGMHGWNGMPFWYSSGDTLTAMGTVLIDSTHFVRHYYLDVDDDSVPDYQLGFGPHWYVPVSGVRRPETGASVVVFGARIRTGIIDHLLVLQIDGREWRPVGGPAPWSGMWIFGNDQDSSFVECLNDSTSWLAFQKGHMGGMNHMGGMHWPDSIFVQFWRIPTDSLPAGQHGRRIAGYHLDVYDPQGMSMMDGRFGARAGMMSFDRPHRIRLHLDEAWGGIGHGPSDIDVWTWHEGRGWMLLDGSDVAIRQDVVEITSKELGSFYVLSVSSAATARTPDEVGGGQPTALVLQNYPNPFDQFTTIPIDLREPQYVVLEVFDLLGRKVSTLVDRSLPSGTTRVVFRPEADAVGVYIYRATIGGRTYSRSMLALE